MVEVPPKPSRIRGTAALMVVSMVLTIAFVALFVGSRQTHEARDNRTYAEDEDDSFALAARTNETLASNPFRATDTLWTPQRPAARPPVSPLDSEAYRGAMTQRAQRRAYEGAPPTVPHGVAEDTAAACNACHRTGAQVGSAVAPVYGHAAYTMCTQCHVASAPGLPELLASSAAGTVDSTFSGLSAAPQRYRWTAFAPPQTPHTTWMRENCAACHGVTGRSGLQTTHPERVACLQCHAPSAQLDQREPTEASHR